MTGIAYATWDRGSTRVGRTPIYIVSLNHSHRCSLSQQYLLLHFSFNLSQDLQWKMLRPSFCVPRRGGKPLSGWSAYSPFLVRNHAQLRQGETMGLLPTSRWDGTCKTNVPLKSERLTFNNVEDRDSELYSILVYKNTGAENVKGRVGAKMRTCTPLTNLAQVGFWSLSV